MGAKQRRQLARARAEAKRVAKEHARELNSREREAIRYSSGLLAELQQRQAERERLSNNKPSSRLVDCNHEFLFQITMNRLMLMQMDDFAREQLVHRFSRELRAGLDKAEPTPPPHRRST